MARDVAIRNGLPLPIPTNVLLAYPQSQAVRGKGEGRGSSDLVGRGMVVFGLEAAGDGGKDDEDVGDCDGLFHGCSLG